MIFGGYIKVRIARFSLRTYRTINQTKLCFFFAVGFHAALTQVSYSNEIQNLHDVFLSNNPVILFD